MGWAFKNEYVPGSNLAWDPELLKTKILQFLLSQGQGPFQNIEPEFFL